jgi:hypothetical protein
MDGPADRAVPGATTGVTAVAERTSDRDADFAAYLSARQASLLRTAYLLTGNRHDAEDLVQTAFAKLYLSWDKVRDQGAIDGYVRRILVNEHNSLWRRAWKRREHPAEDSVLHAIDRPHHDSADDGVGTALWDLVQTLPRKAQRGRDGRGPRHLRRHREVPDQSCALRATHPHPRDPEPPRKRGRPMNEPDELGSQLTRTLSDHADEMQGSLLHLADVRGKARSIRRRRTATTVAGVAAAVALLVPTVALASHQGGTRNVPLPPATQGVTPSPSPVDGEQPATGILDVSDLPTGAAPAMDYVRDGRMHFRDGGEGTVNTRFSPRGLVTMEDGSRVWQTRGNGTPYIELQDSDGTFHQPVHSGEGLTVNPAHSIAAWLSPTGQVIIWEARASEPSPLGDPVPGPELQLGPVSGDDCSLSCTVYVNVRGDTSQPWQVSESGTEPYRDGGYLDVADVSRSGLTVGHTRLTDVGSCSTLQGGGEFVPFSTCKSTLSTFSPDGRLLLGGAVMQDGLGDGSLAMYDVDGRRLFERHATEDAQATYTASAWEDDTHVLIAVTQGARWSLVRVGSDGSMEYAVPPVKGDPVESPFVLPAGGDLPGA